jgi:hypothetical protein
MFRSDDLRQLEERGISIDEARRQMGLLHRPPRYIALDRPCRLGDGIRPLDASALEAGLGDYERARRQGRLSRFVPASGAASRMFQALLWARHECADASRASLQRQAASGDANASDVLAFADNITRFAFYDDLRNVMARHGLDAADLAARGELDRLLDYLLTAAGLDYASLPKGLLQFHRYPGGSRTAFEEHLAEAAEYLAGSDGVARVHFTVSPEHRGRFAALLEAVRPAHRRLYGGELEVGFSVQKPSTDTLAADLDGQPFRTDDGHLLFRPGGHGALIENLNDLQGDVVHVQNVDNVLPDRLRSRVIDVKKALLGLLVGLQKRVFVYLSRLAQGGEDALLDEALRFAARELSVAVPAHLGGAPASARRAFLVERLDRPLRVCGVVANTGEPGGGPFWVRDENGDLSLQIVESAQVDPSSGKQRSIFASSTHFNPVHIACGLRDWRGRPHDLRRFVDAEAVFISRKSKDGRELRALERPGLWNGAMAGWNTVFVELPPLSFAPVKTVNDLLRPEHQAS